MKPRYKIAFVANTSWSLYNFRLGTIKAVQSAGYEVLLIAPQDSYSQKLVDEGFELLLMPLQNYSTNPWTELSVIWWLYKTYKKHRPDFIFHYTIKPNVYGSMMAAILRIPSIAINTGLGILARDENVVVPRVSRLLYRIPLRFSREVWFLNITDRDFFVNLMKVSDSKLTILPSEGIDTDRFQPDANPEKAEGTTFLYVGRILFAKGLKELAEAAQKIKQKYPSTHIKLLGFIEPKNPDGVPEDQIEAWQNEGTITYIGETEDVIPYVKKADCIVLPSYREGISRILLEAAALEKPAIASDVTGCKEVIDDGITGLLCAPYNANDLYEKMDSFMKLSNEERTMMGKAARKKIMNEFDEKLVLEIYLDKLNKYLEGKSTTIESLI